LNGIANPDLIHSGQVLRVPVHPPHTNALRPLPKIRRGLPRLERCGRSYEKPRANKLPDGLVRYCVRVGKGGRVCKQSGDTGETYQVRFLRGRSDHLLFTSQLYDLHRLMRFRVYSADLDGDGRSELVVASHEVTSNGLPRDTYTLAVFDPRKPPGSVVTFESDVPADFELAPLVRPPDERRCSLLVPSFGSGAELGVTRGTGNYEVGRLYRYRRGRLEPRGARPIRWYRIGPNPGEPKDWFRLNMTTADQFGQPWIRGLEREYVDTNLDRARERFGIVEQVRKTARGDELILRVPSEGLGPPRAHVYLFYAPDERYERYIARIGHRSSGRLYPRSYRPAGWRRWLEGELVNVVTYRGFYCSLGETILWRWE